jgi:hypothetical protein
MMTKMEANILLWIKGIGAIFETVVVSLVGIYDLAPSKHLPYDTMCEYMNPYI